MPTIFRKTDKGQAELDSRAHGLPLRLRSLLILVDGRRNAAQLGTLMQRPATEGLALLAEQGYIQSARQHERSLRRAAVAPATPQPVAPTPAAPAADEAAVSEPVVDVRFQARRQAAVHALHDELGPESEDLAQRLADARDHEELLGLLTQAAQLVASRRGRPAGAEYAMRFLVG